MTQARFFRLADMITEKENGAQHAV